MWLRWLPWRYVVRRVARARGFIDPLAVLARLHSFAEPSEVAAPLELLRAGVVFHARGLINTVALQHNLDWVWPYWVERQFDPLDDAFIPRAFSITHVNLTHRNWTALGWPDCESMPIIDPRGLLTPFWDSWSLDAWIVPDAGLPLAPSRQDAVRQRLEWDDANQVRVSTQSRQAGMQLESHAWVALEQGIPACLQQVNGSAAEPAWLVVALRPSNPEGVSFIHDVELLPDDRGWKVDGQRTVQFSEPAESHAMSVYREGDVFSRLHASEQVRQRTCNVGLATAAAMFRLEPNVPRQVTLRIPLAADTAQAQRDVAAGHFPGWQKSLDGCCQLKIPDARMQFLYDAALRTLVLHSPGEVYPGPYTYKRFWFRDAAFILHALLCAGLTDRTKRALDRFPAKQTRAGYFLSQEGEWDSNGEALWIMHRWCQLTNRPPDPAWSDAIRRGAAWIQRKLLADDLGKPHAGLFPAGFSAEHLGPNDYYYWDDFWGVAGLRAAAGLMVLQGEPAAAAPLLQSADRLLAAIDRSLVQTVERRGRPAIPAAPYRRLDTGAVGSLVAGYPLQLWRADDERLLDTVAFLLDHCFVRGGFFQDMIHSGINPYLTLHVAQVLLRAGDPRGLACLQAVADLATPTGQWPEAIHPRTGGGCMGDGQHVWAAAEWVMMLRNCFVREEPAANRLILASGIFCDWVASSTRLSFGPAPTPWGSIKVDIQGDASHTEVAWQADWFGAAPEIEVRLRGHEPAIAARGDTWLRVAHGGVTAKAP